MSKLSPQAEARNMKFASTTWGRTGFDGDAEAGIAGGCAQHPKNGQLKKLNANNNVELVAA